MDNSQLILAIVDVGLMALVTIQTNLLANRKYDNFLKEIKPTKFVKKATFYTCEDMLFVINKKIDLLNEIL